MLSLTACFHFCLLPFMRDCIFLMTPLKEKRYILGAIFSPKWLQSLGLLKCKMPVSQGKWQGLLGLFTKRSCELPVDVPLHPSLQVLCFIPLLSPKLSACNKYMGLNFKTRSGSRSMVSERSQEMVQQPWVPGCGLERVFLRRDLLTELGEMELLKKGVSNKANNPPRAEGLWSSAPF